MFNLSSYYDFTSHWYTATPSSQNHYDQHYEHDCQLTASNKSKHAMSGEFNSTQSAGAATAAVQGGDLSPYSKKHPELYRSSSTSSSSSSSSNELATPPTSPSASSSTLLQWPHHHKHIAPCNDIKGKGKPAQHQQLDDASSSIRDNTSLVPKLKQPRRLPPLPTLPIATPTQAQAQLVSPQSHPARTTTTALPSPHYSTKVAAQSPAAVSPSPISRSAPSAGSREYDELRRGRSRWPRLLWRSELDPTSLNALGAYHARAVGGPLPVLPTVDEARRRPERVRQWSREMEKAGL